uniref:Pre-mRNA-splicing factor prp45 n=1 Tax=Arundo donax TaxID=35708 RepID=A0A0A9GY88_ARUDO
MGVRASPQPRASRRTTARTHRRTAP